MTQADRYDTTLDTFDVEWYQNHVGIPRFHVGQFQFCVGTIQFHVADVIFHVELTVSHDKLTTCSNPLTVLGIPTSDCATGSRHLRHCHDEASSAPTE